MSLIEKNLYHQILHNMPIICVDAVIVNEEGKILFLKRDNEPAKNEWWFPGGRLLKNERLEDAVIRKVKEETNIDANVDKFLGTTETIFKTGPNNIPVHTVNFTFLLNFDSAEIKIDNLHTDFIWESDYELLDLNSEIYSLLKNNFQND